MRSGLTLKRPSYSQKRGQHPDARGCSATPSRSVEGDGEELWTSLAVLKAFRYHAECERLHLRQSHVFALAVGKDTRELQDFG